MQTKTCEYCGVEFEARNDQDNVCNDCRLEMFHTTEQKKKRKTQANQRIIDQVKEAEALGLSYGKYKGRGK